MLRSSGAQSRQQNYYNVFTYSMPLVVITQSDARVLRQLLHYGLSWISPDCSDADPLPNTLPWP